jgi:hypothetical protein
MADEKQSIIERLIAARMEFGPLIMDSKNPHFNSKYASLLAVNQATDPALLKHGLLPSWSLKARDGGAVEIEFFLTSADGQTISSGPVAFSFTDPQKAGSAITYGKRYTKCALLGVVAEEDDDGNAASAPPKKAKAAPTDYSPRYTPPDPAPVSKETADFLGVPDPDADLKAHERKTISSELAADFTAAINAARDTGELDTIAKDMKAQGAALTAEHLAQLRTCWKARKGVLK